MNAHATSHTSPAFPRITLLVATVFLLAAAHPLLAQSIPNPSFETNTFVTIPGYITGNTPITGWTASDPGRIGQNPYAGVNNPFADNGIIPNGTRVAFIQSTGSTSTLSTTITGLTVGTSYRVQFRANARTGSTPAPSYRINGGAPVRFAVSPVNAVGVFTNPYSTITAIFTATATTAALEISNSTAADSTLLVDNFTIVAATNITVNTTADEFNTPSGVAVSLREALRDAAATATTANVITFAAALNGATLTLGSEIVVSDPSGVVIDASSLSSGLTIHGGPGTNRIFSVATGTLMSLRRLTLNGGNGTGATLSGEGGAILNQGMMTMTQCTFTGNAAATRGGAVFTQSHLDIKQCTFSGNSAAGFNTFSPQGGAIYNITGTLALTHCTISGNSSTEFGGGITNLATLTVTNCIIAGNTATSGPGGADIDNFGGTVTRVGANIIQALENSSGSTDSGPAAFNAAPLLSPLASNGGPTQTRAIAATSPARNAATGSNITSDQRGRPLVGTADIGAFELQAGSFTLSATTYKTLEGSPATVTINRGGEASGTVIVRLTNANGSATAPADFTARPNTAASDVEFLNGETTKNVEIPTVADFLVEGNHTFSVSLSIPVATIGAATVSPLTATVTIVDPIQVTTINDDGPGSLRDAFRKAAANTVSGDFMPDAIHFNPALNGQTITLGSEIAVGDAIGVTVDAGNLPAGLTIDGGPGTNRIFYVANGTLMTLRRLTLTGGNGIGVLEGTGGAILNEGFTTLERCTVSGNTTTSAGGGGISNVGTLTLTQCTVSGNTAATMGGGIDNFGTLTLTQCTVSGNTAASIGGGIHNFVNLTLNRCLVAGNDVSGSPASADIYTLFLPLEGVSIVNALVGTASGSGSRIQDSPLDLGPLAANGGPTKTHALLPGSPAINAASGSSVTSDQRGLTIVGGTADIGAFEVQGGGVFVIDTATSPLHYTPNEGNQAAVTVRRTGGFSGSATVQLTTTSGTAILGTDFTNATQLLTFNGNENEKIVNILTTNDGPGEAVEFFNVTLSAPSVGTTLGSPSSAKVYIIDPTATVTTPGGDLANPVVSAVSAPAAGATVNVDAGGNVTVSGTATDNKGVKFVYAQINNDAPVFLTLATPGAPSTSFTGTLPDADTGFNTVTIFALDFAGRTSAYVVRTIKVLRPLLVNVSGNGSVTAGYVQKSYREVGRPHTLTATAGSGAIFSGWSVLSGHSNTVLGTNALALEKNTLTFIHRDNLVLRANFVPNPYLPAITGIYEGGITASTILPAEGGSAPGGTGTASALDSEGYISVKLEPTGAFSGSMKIDGLTLGVAGVFDHNGGGRFGTSRAKTLSVARANKPSFNVALNIDLGNKKITGNVWLTESGQTVAMSFVEAHRAAYSATSPVPTSPFLAAGGADGFYTMFMVTPTPAFTLLESPLNDDQYPQGRGHGTVKLTKTGAISVTGKLPDNTPFTMSTTLSQTGTWRLFVQLYPGLQGILAGNVAFNHADTETDFYAPTIWICPIQDRQHYPLGWTEGITISTVGSKYVVPPALPATSVMPLNQATGTGDGNATLNFYQGLLSKNVDISTADVVTEVPVDPGYSLIINRTTGSYSGDFTHSDGTKIPFSGIIYQKANLGNPGYFLSPTPAVKNYLGESGPVSLDPQ